MPPPPLPLGIKEVQDDKDSLKDAEEYLRDSGIAFNDQDDDQRVYEQARRSRGRGRGRGQSRDQSRRRETYISPPSSAHALPSTPSPFLMTSPSNLPQSPRRAQSDGSYSDLLAAFQRQQEVIARLRRENEEHARNEDSLRADLLAMTHRYLQTQATIETLERRCRNAEEHAERFAFHQQFKEQQANAGNSAISKRSPECSSPGMWSVVGERDSLRGRSGDDRGDTATISAGTVDSSEYVSVDLSSSSSLNLRPSIPPEAVLELIRTINLHIHEVARACIASANVRPGVRHIQADNKMVVDLTEGIGCILVQMLRSRDHSKNKAIVELCFRALLSYHVFKLVEDWPFHAQTKRKCEQSTEEQYSNMDKEFSEGVEKALRDIATVLSLSGCPGDPASLVRNHRDRIGSTLDALLKTAENLANQVKGGRFEGSSPGEYSFLFARPGATFDKELMQRHASQQSMAIWRGAPKKPVKVLCTREVGLARLYRMTTSRSTGSTSRTNLHSGDGNQGTPSHVKEIEVLAKVIVVFESDIDK